mmetsp:Transcript_79994/g.239652  ORF Transcript_79994/g.239652 Transcript_79994/m.239652 type:complete len:183 (-) Transcript_79994:353-901(-)
MSEATPFHVLRLDPAHAFDAESIKSAFLGVAHESRECHPNKPRRWTASTGTTLTLADPDKNPDCRQLAAETFVAARRARDTLLRMTTAFGEPDSKVIAEGILSTEVGQPAPAMLSALRLGGRWLRDLRRTIAGKVLEMGRSAEAKLSKLKEIFTHSVAYYWRHPAVFIFGSIVLQLIALWQL